MCSDPIYSTPDFARSMDSGALKGWGWNSEDDFASCPM
jgi:hypothetical protein